MHDKNKRFLENEKRMRMLTEELRRMTIQITEYVDKNESLEASLKDLHKVSNTPSNTCLANSILFSE
jgi:hypothetical protein